jgi:hypothetical protein
MTVFPGESATNARRVAPRHSRAPTLKRRNSPDVSFAVWATIALIGLSIISIASGVATYIEPDVSMFAAP